MYRLFNKQLLFIIVAILVFIGIRSVHFIDHLNFTIDQAQQSTTVLELLRSHKITLIGNETSINFQGKRIYQGPVTYLMQFIFLVMGNFDPVASSFAFLLFSAFMIIPLYYGMKLLLNQRSAIIMVILYALLPYFINYTRFLWNPNFQFALLPLLVLLMGIYKNKPSTWLFFVISCYLGFLLEFHYQFVLVIFGLFIYYFFFAKTRPLYVVLFIVGLAIGMSPLILFEVRHNFYLTQTALLFINNYRSLNTPGTPTTPHYYLSTFFFGCILALSCINILVSKLNSLKLKKSHRLLYAMRTHEDKMFIALAALLTLTLFIRSALFNFPQPQNSFWSGTDHWSYRNDYKIYQNIKQSGITKDFNIADLAYDTLSLVPKYLLKRDYINIDYGNYSSEKYLFVVDRNNHYMNNPAYEVNTFKPSKQIKEWNINGYYHMYLLERTTE